MKKENRIMKKILVFAAAFAFCAALLGKPVDTKAATYWADGLKQVSATETSITVTWTAVPGVAGYELRYGTSSNINYSKISCVAAANATSATLSNLPKNSSLYVFVQPYILVNGVKSYDGCYDDYIWDAVTLPTAPNNLYADFYTKSSMKLIWGVTSIYDNTDGYEVEAYRIKNGKTPKNPTKRLTSTNPFTNYVSWGGKTAFRYPFKFRVRTYVTINNQKFYSAWSAYKQCIPGASIKKSKRYYGSSSATLTWYKVNSAKSYDVYWATGDYNGPTSKWKRVKKNVKGTSATVKYSKSASYNYYYIKPNKVKIGKKRVSAPKPTSVNSFIKWRVY
ncbi:MAG: fibronectin type III domain-containing protein [Lachnospiraceae bacterium]|nr:fibronectin type III domain-containing protein [Lachnospiraceae bacterium]